MQIAEVRYDATKISVCLLNYNHAHLLESTVKSVLAQDCDGFEIIISDDCSTDRSWEIIQKLALWDERIIPLRTPRNLRMPGNANFAVDQSTRPYIALLHHDDICRPDLLRRWGQSLDKHPQVAFIFNAYGVHGSNHVYGHPFGEGVLEGRWLLERHLLPNWGCPVRGTAMIRRDCWDAVAGMDEQFDLLADVDLWMRLAAMYDVAYISEPLLYLRQDRSADYPESYTGSAKGFWQRRRYLYQIHVRHRRILYENNSLSNKCKWLLFRSKLSAETLKWLGYAVMRNRQDLLVTSPWGAVPEEFFFVGWLRWLLAKWYATQQRTA